MDIPLDLGAVATGISANVGYPHVYLLTFKAQMLGIGLPDVLPIDVAINAP